MIHTHCSYEACKSCTHTELKLPESVRVGHAEPASCTMIQV